MNELRTREPRVKTFLQAQLRDDLGWRDATIGNASSRGLMLRCKLTPLKGAVIEVRASQVTVVGRVVWSSGACCGIRTQDPLDLSMLVGRTPDRSPPLQFGKSAAPERRPQPRRSGVAAEAVASANAAKLMDWLTVAVTGAAAVGLLGNIAADALGKPLGDVNRTLAVANHK